MFNILKKCLMFTKNNKIKVKHEIGGKIDLYSCCNDCSFKFCGY